MTLREPAGPKWHATAASRNLSGVIRAAYGYNSRVQQRIVKGAQAPVRSVNTYCKDKYETRG